MRRSGVGLGHWRWTDSTSRFWRWGCRRPRRWIRGYSVLRQSFEASIPNMNRSISAVKKIPFDSNFPQCFLPSECLMSLSFSKTLKIIILSFFPLLKMQFFFSEYKHFLFSRGAKMSAPVFFLRKKQSKGNQKANEHRYSFLTCLMIKNSHKDFYFYKFLL